MAHFFSSSTLVCNKCLALDPIKIHTPSGTVLHSMRHEVDLDLLGLPLVACHGHIVPQLATQPLLSIGQLCDASCNVAFTADHVTVKHNNTVILQKHHTAITKLWELDIQPNDHHLHTWPMPPLAVPHPLNWWCFAHVASSAQPSPP